MIHAFGDFELDLDLFELRRSGKVVKLEPKVFDLLTYLIRHRDRVVSKAELLDKVWPDQIVSESVLPSGVAAIRRATGAQGRGEPIQTVHGRGYRFVAAVREVAGAPAPAAKTPTPFIGRADTMGRLRAALEAVLGGEGWMLLLVGEPGIGKTRTADEIAAEAAARGARVLAGRCYEGEGAPPFWPWIQILRELWQREGSAALVRDAGAGAADIAELLPELRDSLPALPPSGGLEGEQARFRLFDGVTGVLKRAAARSPLLLILDDLHWADVSSLRLVRFLAGGLRNAGILVVATYRDVEVRRGHPLLELLGELARESHCDRILLRGLDADDTERFVSSLAAGAATPAIAGALLEMTEGNPFFLQEVVRLLTREGSLDSVVTAGAASLALPQSVRDAIGRRLDTLSEEAGRVLRWAAVLGREFSATLLGRAAGLPGDRVAEALEEANAAGVLDNEPGGPDRWIFRHALIRQTLYSELRAGERVALHRATAEALEEAYAAQPEPHLAELAHHFCQAAVGGDVQRAVAYCERAADLADRVFAYEESARQYEQARQALELEIPRDEYRRCELLLAEGEEQLRAGARGKAQALCASAAETARGLSRPDLLARAALIHRGPYEMGSPDDPDSLALLDESLAELGEEHPELRAQILHRLTGTLAHSGSMEERERLGRESYALALRSGDPVALRDGLGARLWACVGPARVDARSEAAGEMIALGERQGDMRMVHTGYEVRIISHLQRGDLDAAEGDLAAVDRLAQELRQPHFLSLVSMVRGSLALARGRFDEAERHIDEAYSSGRGVSGFAHFIYAGQTLSLASERGDFAGLERVAGLLEEMFELPYPWHRALRSFLAFVQAVQGDTQSARHELAALFAEGPEQFPLDEHWLVTMTSMGSLCLLLSDTAGAERLYPLLEPYADLYVVHDQLRTVSGNVAASLGGLAALLGRHAEAVAHCERAVARDTAAGARTSWLHSQARFAWALQQRDEPGDRARAERMIAEVEAEARSLGASGRPLALALLDRIPGTP